MASDWFCRTLLRTVESLLIVRKSAVALVAESIFRQKRVKAALLTIHWASFAAHPTPQCKRCLLHLGIWFQPFHQSLAWQRSQLLNPPQVFNLCIHFIAAILLAFVRSSPVLLCHLSLWTSPSHNTFNFNCVARTLDMCFAEGGQIIFFGTIVSLAQFIVDSPACHRSVLSFCRRLIFETASALWSFEPASQFHQEAKVTES